MARRLRQAVVVIHGMGEPRPNAFVRSFVRVAFPARTDGKRPWFSKADRLSRTIELRRMTVRSSGQRPVTDVYEYYWAHLMTGNQLAHLWPLVRTVLLRLPWRVPGSLRFMWVFTWGLAAWFAVLIWSAARDGAFSDGFSLSTALEAIGLPGWATVLLSLGLLVLQGFMVGFFVDVARYVSTKPSNVAVRQTIREGGLELLTRLSEDRSYDRIVVVAHSLGSFVAYDILNLHWNATHGIYRGAADGDQTALQRVQEAGTILARSPDEGLVRAYRAAQREAWISQRRMGSPWLVTDLVTLGSPLTFAAMLLGRDEAEVRARQRDLELPTCPPVPDEGRWFFPRRRRAGGRRVLVLHQAAQFALTRWTNVWFPSRFGIFGDWFGGPLAAVFGPGVADRPVTAADSVKRWVPAWGHVLYFTGAQPPPAGSSLAHLREGMDLESAEWLARARAGRS